ncbi:class I SAM-dependent methyltransferase [Bacillus kwashiorkori]|uniref:class I SAM-dependent methyltransferase n=1 Tax=Bacillus kwashiorkori TaxID=1522318 RepID=UPI000782D9CE|nr:class I SAM-dependent methyltransferase [Bacillus kwashiorkori]
MLQKDGFDLWADNYDQTVQIIEENNKFPFAGYKQILNVIYNEIMQNKNSKVLDIGFGTGVLTTELYKKGHIITGIDFSARMLEIAKAKMPNARLIQSDINDGIPLELKEEKFDYIVSTYALHHLSDEDKVSFILELLPLLAEKGIILIGDISFDSREALENCRLENVDSWDPDEFYFVAKEIKSDLVDRVIVNYNQISYCGGIYWISNK